MRPEIEEIAARHRAQDGLGLVDEKETIAALIQARQDIAVLLSCLSAPKAEEPDYLGFKGLVAVMADP
jgi:hypothetical protein